MPGAIAAAQIPGSTAGSMPPRSTRPRPTTRDDLPVTSGNRRGNPNLALAARCGAHTRAGCPCRAPAIHGKFRCRIYGGRSTGPCTEDGMARLRAARTTHCGYSVGTRTRDRHILSVLIAVAKEAACRGVAPSLVTDSTGVQAPAKAHAPEQPPVAAMPPGLTEAGITTAWPEAHAPEQPPVASAPSGPAEAGIATAWPEAHAPEQPPVAATPSEPAEAGITTARPEPHAPEQPPVAATPSGPAKPGVTTARPEPHAPEPLPVATAPSGPAKAGVTTVRPEPHAPEPPPVAAAPSGPVKAGITTACQTTSGSDPLATCKTDPPHVAILLCAPPSVLRLVQVVHRPRGPARRGAPPKRQAERRAGPLGLWTHLDKPEHGRWCVGVIGVA